jgi:hypothetical protein
VQPERDERHEEVVTKYCDDSRFSLDGRDAGLGRAQLRSSFRKYSIRLGEGYEFNISKFEGPRSSARLAGFAGRVGVTGQISGHAGHENARASKGKAVINSKTITRAYSTND